MENYAKENGFDPLVPQNWYYLRTQALSSKAVRSVVSKYEYSFTNAMMHLFPEIGLEPDKFAVVPRQYWLDMNNRRRFFEKFAQQKRFNPLIPNNWYDVPSRTILAAKGAGRLLAYYQGSYAKALIHLFPELHFDKRKFPTY